MMSYSAMWNELPPLTWGLIYFLLFILLIRYVQWKISRRHLYEMAAKVPFPKSLKMYPVVGHLPHLVGLKSPMCNLMIQLIQEETPIVLWAGPICYFYISQPQHLETILTHPNCFGKENRLKFLEPYIGKNNILISDPHEWRPKRKLLNTTFNRKTLDAAVQIASEQSVIFCDILKKYDGKGVFDIFEPVLKLMLDVLLETTMGVQANSQTTESPYFNNSSIAMSLGTLRMFNFLYAPNFIFENSKHGKEQARIVNYFQEYAQKVIDSKKAEHINSKNVVCTEEKSKRKAFLELLLELADSSKEYQEGDFIGDVVGMMMAGTETVATTISIAALMLGMHPEYQKKVYDEVIDIVGSHRCVAPADLPKLKYLDMFIKETMRLFPAGPVIGRVVDEDIKLDGYVIPKNANILIPILGVHRDPKNFSNPLIFNPDRFCPEEESKRNPFTYLPFSKGPRNCIGYSYAMNAMKANIANIVRHYQFATTFKKIEDIEVLMRITIHSVKGYPISITRRN